MNTPELPPFWALIPAAGVGSRMAADRPKQYLEVVGKTIIEHSLACFLDHPHLRSVLTGLRRRGELGGRDDDWVLVHDAARPNLARSDLDLLLAELASDPVGGLLAVPARDTLKRAGPDGRVRETVDRTTIWQAYTPQMFRLGELQRALADALLAGVAITDEASAMEWAGHAPRLIEGRGDNLKVTRPEDLLGLRRLWRV